MGAESDAPGCGCELSGKRRNRLRIADVDRTDRDGVVHEGACRLHWLFSEVDELVRSTYESVTLATLVRRAGRQAPPPLLQVAKRSKR